LARIPLNDLMIQQLCELMGGSIPDVVNFGKRGSDRRVRFTSDLFLSAKIPRVFQPSTAAAPEDGSAEGESEVDEGPAHKTPLNMVSK